MSRRARKSTAPASRWSATRHGRWRIQRLWSAPTGESGASWEVLTATNVFAEMVTRRWWKTSAVFTTNERNWPPSRESNRNGRCSWPTNWSQPVSSSAGTKPGSGVNGWKRFRWSAMESDCSPSCISYPTTCWSWNGGSLAVSAASPMTMCRCSGPRAWPGLGRCSLMG